MRRRRMSDVCSSDLKQFVFELLQSEIKRVRETCLLGMHRLRNTIRAFFQFGIGVLYQIAYGKNHLIKKRLSLSKQPSMSNGAANDLAQNVPAAFIGRHDAI